MARATFVKKARKSIKGTDIKKGDSYYWWKFRFGGKHVSKTPPRRSQLTQSAFYSSIYDIEDDLASLPAAATMADNVSAVIDSLRELAEECESSLSNMPDALQEGDTGQMLTERAEACNNAADELEAIDFDIKDKENNQTEEEFWQSKIEEVQNITIGAP